MPNSVAREQIMLELEKKWKGKKLKQYLDKMAEVEKLKQSEDEEIMPVKKRVKAEEIIDRIDRERRDRFRDDKESIEAMAKLRKGKPPPIWETPYIEQEYLGYMYPVEPSVLAVLYEGYNNYPGRVQYLKLRNKLDPWERYLFSPTFNLDYGWRVEERKLPTNKQFANIEIINRTFYRRNELKMMEFRKEMALKQMAKTGKAKELAWFKKYFKRIYIDSGLLPQEIPRGAITLYKELMDWEDHAKAQGEAYREKMKIERTKPPTRRWKPTIVTRWDLDRGVMYPVEPELTALLYEGISHNDEGRLKYLYFRNQDAPYEKFYDPLSHGMDYGWKIEERCIPANKEFAKKLVIQPEFYRRNGVKNETLRNRLPIPVSRVEPEQLS